MKLCHGISVGILKVLLCVQTYFVILSSIDLGSNINVGSVTRLRSAPGRSCDMMCMSTVECIVSYVIECASMQRACDVDMPLPWSVSTTVSSSLVTSSLLISSIDDRLPNTRKSAPMTLFGAIKLI